MAKILVIDEERSIRNTLKDMLEYEGYLVTLASDGKEGVARSLAEDFDFILCDTKYSLVDGEDMIDIMHKTNTDVRVMMTSREPKVDVAISLLKRGAYDFFEKPIDLNRLLGSLKSSVKKATAAPVVDAEEFDDEPQISRINGSTYRTSRSNRSGTAEIIGQSPQIMHIKRLIDKVAPSEARVLITGENGTGKELVARWLHEKSSRANGPFVEVNCAAIPADLIESELFGHEKGAFTSAIRQRKGKFEQAHGGTLFLDEIGDMSHSAQAKILRTLQENRVSRVGSDKDITVDVRVVAATNKDLFAEIAKNNFREDLYHRLSVIVIRVPSLNDRSDDIPLLINSFIGQICTEYGIERKSVDAAAMTELQKMNWTGNIRQLRNVVERLIILSSKSISLEDVKLYAFEH